MTCLLLRLAGPLQAWGSRSRFVRRDTEPAPTKSGVIGMLAAARGVRRTDDLTEFLGLSFGVRVDQPGKLTRDFQTARSLDGGKSMPLSYRQYLADAVFVAAVEGDTDLLQGLHEAVRAPVFPLYLGRRSCPPVLPISLGLCDRSLREALEEHRWEAAEWHREKLRRQPTIALEVFLDAEPGDPGAQTIRDEPLSFDPARREYGWRTVIAETIEFPNLDYNGDAGDGLNLDHDPFALLDR